MSMSRTTEVIAYVWSVERRNLGRNRSNVFRSGKIHTEFPNVFRKLHPPRNPSAHFAPVTASLLHIERVRIEVENVNLHPAAHNRLASTGSSLSNTERELRSSVKPNFWVKWTSRSP